MKVRIIMLMLFTFLVTGCHKPQIPQGHEGVELKQPYIFGSGGISDRAYTTGRQTVAMSTSLLLVDMRPKRFDESFNDLVPKNKTPIDFQAYITISVKKGQSPSLVTNFGENWYRNNIQKQFRSIVRDLVRNYTSDEMIASPEIIQELVIKTMAGIIEFNNSKTIPVPVEFVEIGFDKLSPPDTVLEEIGRTAAQEQRVQTEIARERAEASRELAEIAKAKSDKAYMDEFDMNVNQYLVLRSIEIEREKIEVVKNKDNVHIIMSTGGSSANTLATFNVD